MMAASKYFLVGTAGHVDHGKSALVRALTGTDPDRLPEERQRGITIDLGFAELRLSQAGSPAIYQVGIVDVPGHEDFIKNMVAGVGAIDAAILVVAADDGWMPQTEEHLQILSYLGVNRGVVALTKMDLIRDDGRERAASEAVRAKLAGTTLEATTIVPISVVSGRGIEELKTALAAELSKAAARSDLGKPRLAIDRAFMLKGVGTVVTGSLTGGTLRRGQQVTIAPAGFVTRIRTIQQHGRDVAEGFPGSRVALNLPDVQPAARGDSATSAAVVRRGDGLTSAALARPTRRLIARMMRFARGGEEALPIGTSDAFKSGATLHFYHGTAACGARIRLIDQDVLDSGGAALAMLTLKLPMLLFAGDRFVLRDGCGQATVAGGIVLEPHAAVRSKWRQGYVEALRALVERAHDPRLHAIASLMQHSVVSGDQLLAQSTFSGQEIANAVEHLISTGTCVRAGRLLVMTRVWKELCESLVQQMRAHHQAHPEQAGLALSELRAELARRTRRIVPKSDLPELERALLDEISRGQVVRNNGVLRLASHQPSLPARLRQAGEHVRKRLAEQPFAPPSRKEVAADDLAHQALRFLISTGGAVEVSSDVVLLAHAYEAAVCKIRDHLQLHAGATVSELKSVLQSNRRVMVPLLEYLDRAGITRRDGDLRRLR